jgi:hypothetical protein
LADGCWLLACFRSAIKITLFKERLQAASFKLQALSRAGNHLPELNDEVVRIPACSLKPEACSRGSSLKIRLSIG